MSLSMMPVSTDDVRDLAASVIEAAERMALRGDPSNGPPLLAAVRVLRGCDSPRDPARRRHFGLTEREADVLALVALGFTNVEAAQRLFVAPGTVKKHLDHIYTKLGVRSRTEAAALTRLWGMQGHV